MAWYPLGHSKQADKSRSDVYQPVGQLLHCSVSFVHFPGSQPGQDVSPAFLAFMHGKQSLPSPITGLYVKTGHILQSLASS